MSDAWKLCILIYVLMAQGIIIGASILNTLDRIRWWEHDTLVWWLRQEIERIKKEPPPPEGSSGRKEGEA